MRLRVLCGLLVLAFVTAGCVVASDADQRAKAAEFNQKAVEDAIRKKGEGKDLEEANKRAAAYRANSGDSSEQGNAGTQPGQ